MKELKDFEFAPTGALLNWSFRVCRESNQPVDFHSAGGTTKRGSQDVRLLTLQQASRVVAFVDRKLTDVQRALVRFCFARTSDSDADQSRNYNLLHNWVWRERKLLPAEVDEVATNLRVISLMVPYEVRHRIYGMKRGYSLQNLADILDIPKTSFQRDCKTGWYAMVDILWDERTQAFSAIDGFMDDALRRKLPVVAEQEVQHRESLKLPVQDRPSLDPDMLVVAEIAKYFKERSAAETGLIRSRASAAVRYLKAGEGDERLEKTC